MIDKPKAVRLKDNSPAICFSELEAIYEAKCEENHNRYKENLNLMQYIVDLENKIKKQKKIIKKLKG